MPVALGALSVTLSQCCRRLVAASFIGIKCHRVVPTAGANSHTEESGLCVLFQFAQSRVLGGNTRKAGSPISKTLHYLYNSAKASAFIGYKFPNFSIHEHPNRCLLLDLAFLVPIRQLPLRAVSHRRDWVWQWSTAGVCSICPSVCSVCPSVCSIPLPASLSKEISLSRVAEAACPRGNVTSCLLSQAFP